MRRARRAACRAAADANVARCAGEEIGTMREVLGRNLRALRGQRTHRRRPNGVTRMRNDAGLRAAAEE